VGDSPGAARHVRVAFTQPPQKLTEATAALASAAASV
jgi:hypothetical protein